MDLWLKTGSLKHKLKMRKSKHDNEGNSEQSEITKYCDKNMVGSEATHCILTAGRITSLSQPQLGIQEGAAALILKYTMSADASIKCGHHYCGEANEY